MNYYFHNKSEDSSEQIVVPTRLPSSYGYIIDFSIAEAVVGLVSSTKEYTSVSEGQDRYWKSLKLKIG